MFLVNKYVMILLATIFFAAPIALANVAVEECKLSRRSFNSAEFQTLVNKRIYALSVNNKSDWLIEPYGNHAAGSLTYKTEDEVIARGLYNFFSELKAQEHDYPLNADERIKRGQEVFSYPLLVASGSDLSVSSTIPDVIIDNFTGYAVAFDLNENWMQPRSKSLPDLKKLSLVIISLTDNCVRFDTTLMVNGDKANADKLMRNIVAFLKINMS